MNDHVGRKVTSGRWLCTLGVVVVFAYCAVALKLFSAEQILDVTKLVLVFYFAGRVDQAIDNPAKPPLTTP